MNQEKFIIFGIGINGCESVNNLINSKLENVEFFAACENENALNSCKADKKFLIQDDQQFFDYNFIDADIIFILYSGENGRKGEKFALNIARSAKLKGVLTLIISNNDIEDFKNYSDSVIFPLMNNNESLIITSIIYSIIKSGLINIDLADVKKFLYNSGSALFGSFCVSSHDKISREILNMREYVRGSRNILINFTTGSNITLGELADIARIFEAMITPDSSFIWGHYLDENIRDSITIDFIICMNDGGYVDYYEMFKHERTEILKDLIINGLSDSQLVKLGSYKKFFVSCIMYGNPELLNIFINNGHDPRELQENGVFPENILCELINYHDERETLEILDIIFSTGINLSKNLIQPFFTCKATPEIYESFIKYGWNVNSCTQSGMTILMFAINKATFKHAKILVDSGADVNSCDNEGKTPLMYINYNDSECTEKLRLLIEHGADINKTDKDGRNAFIHAAKNIYYRPEIIKIFIESGININSQDNNGRDALEIMNLQNNNASKREIFYRYVLPLMIKSGADAKFYNNINFFREYNNLYADFKYICGSYQDYKIKSIRKLFYDSIINYDIDFLEKLLNSFKISDFLESKYINFAFRINFFPDSDNNNNKIKRNFEDGARILKLLRKNGFDIPVIAPDDKELTYIISKSKVNLTSYTGERVPNNILDLLCCAYSPGAFEKIISSGVDIKSCKNILNVIANNYADYYRPEKIISILLENGADYSGLANTWIYHSIESGDYIKLDDIRQIKIILQIFSRPEIKILMHKKFSLEWDNYFGDLLCRFMLRNMWDALEYSQENINNLLILAACHGNINFIDYALKNGADINYMTNQGFTPLIYAAVFNNSKIVRYLLQKGARLYNVLKIFLSCYYHKKDSNTLYELINAGADVNEIYSGGITPLMIAAKNCVYNNSEIISMLIDSGADINARRKNGDTAFSIACKFNNIDAVKILLDSGADKTNIPEKFNLSEMRFCPICGTKILRK